MVEISRGAVGAPLVFKFFHRSARKSRRPMGGRQSPGKWLGFVGMAAATCWSSNFLLEVRAKFEDTRGADEVPTNGRDFPRCCRRPVGLQILSQKRAKKLG